MNQWTKVYVQHPILDAAETRKRERKEKTTRESTYSNVSLSLRNASLFEDRVNLEGYFSLNGHRMGDGNFRENSALGRATSASFTSRVGEGVAHSQTVTEVANRLTTIVNQSSVFLSPIRRTNAKRCSTRPLVGVVDVVFAENRGRNGRKWQTLQTWPGGRAEEEKGS